jgi:hypothetical protein
MEATRSSKTLVKTYNKHITSISRGSLSKMEAIYSSKRLWPPRESIATKLRGSTLKMGAISSSEKIMIISETTRRHSPEDHSPNLHRRGNLKSHVHGSFRNIFTKRKQPLILASAPFRMPGNPLQQLLKQLKPRGNFLYYLL